MKPETAQDALLAAALCFACVAAHGQSMEMQNPSPIVATIDVQQTAPPVSKYEFGMFIEHIRTLIDATESEQKFDLNVTGARLAGPSTLWQMTGSGLDAAIRLVSSRKWRQEKFPLATLGGRSRLRRSA